MDLKRDPRVQAWVDSFGNWFDREGAFSGASMGGKLYPYDAIFSPIRINRLTVKNRIVMAPMGNISMCEETGRPNDKMLEYFIERAKGGTGLITTGLVPVSHKEDNTISELGDLSYFPRADRSRTVIAGWRDLAQGVHVHGAKIFLQLTPGLGRVGNPQCLLTKLKLPQSASTNPNFYMPQVPSVRMSGGKLKSIVKNMGQGAADAKHFGMDGVYLHGHEGYLLEQMTNPAYNRRKLGRYADWQAFGIDCVTEMRRRVGADYPIMYRIDLSLALNETYGENIKNTSLKKFTNGRTIDMTLEYMKNLVSAGVDIFDVDLGSYDNWWLPHPPASMPPGCFLEVSKIVKDYFKANKIQSNAGIEVPVVGVGKLGYPDLAERALREGDCDMVMLGRPLLADPEWCNKAYKGEIAHIRPCIGCQEACINEFVEGGHPQCAVNPRSGFEHIFPSKLTIVAKPKRIAVVGGGPAGIIAAVIAAKRGHKVTLYEKTGRLGGRLVPGGVPKIKYEIANYRAYLENLVKETEEKNGLKVLLNTAADTETLKAKNYDGIVFALGTIEKIPPFPGVDKVKAVRASDLLGDEKLIVGAKKAVVVGGGMVGCETAYWLRYEKGLDVKVVEMDKYIMNHVCTANRGHLIHYLQAAGVELHNCTKVTGFEDGAVKVLKNVSKTVPDPYITWHPILPENIHNPLEPALKIEEREIKFDAELFVIATGGSPDDALFFEAQKEHAAPEIHNIGDSFASGLVWQATKSAYRLAITL
ncbi:MAG: NAD(P)/FAD-dependent oxidoreductase [Oscillospiraceae bacterium]|jgi:2-enoate reductase|nr:NAD(P)/FAD-dependent oxidoreductase [Oscillospiraceae bacterium]